MLKLFDYQRDAVDAVLNAYRGGMRRPALSAATGAGKTIMFAKAIEESGERSLVIAHRKEIIEQAAQKIGYIIDPADVGIVMADRNQGDRPIVVASIQTIANPKRLARLGRFGLVVIDEAHHASSPSYVNTLRMLGVSKTGPTRALGVSATWDRADGVGFEEVFEEIVYAIGIEQLIASGHLADITALRIETELDTDGIPKDVHGDWRAEALSQRIEDSNYADTMAAAVAAHAQDRTCLVFAPNVRTADLYRDALIDCGIAAASVNGETPTAQREQAIADLKARRIRAIVNCGVFTEGTDIPIVDCVVMGRPTKSRALYQQMAGRGLRNYPGKQNCLILDLVDNSSRNELQSVGSLVGLNPSKPRNAITSLRAAIAEDAKQGTLVTATDDLKSIGKKFVQHAKPIELIDRKKLAWIQIDNGAFSIPVGEHGQIVLQDNDRGLFDVVRYGRKGDREVLGHDMDIGYAQGIAEQTVIEAGARTLANPKAGWRRDKKALATEPQKVALRKWKIPFDAETITKVQASDLLSEAIARANMRRGA